MQTENNYNKGRGCFLFLAIICFLIFIAPAAFITWENITWKSRAEKMKENEGPTMFNEILEAPTIYKCVRFLREYKGMKDECKNVSHILDSLVLRNYQENDTDVVRLAYYVYCNLSTEGTPTVDNIMKQSKERLKEIWNKDTLLAEYGMRHYADLASFLFRLNEDYAWRWVQLSKEYEEYREQYPNSKYDKLAYRKIIEQAIESGEYEELQPLKQLGTSNDGFAHITIDNLSNHPITVTFLNIKELDDINKISVSDYSKGKITIKADDYKIYAKTDDKSNVSSYASKFTKISSGKYELSFIVVTKLI